MSVNAFTVDGVINIDTTAFDSAIKKVSEELALLGNSTKQLMEMGGGNWNFNGALNGLKTLKDDIAVIKEDIATMNTEFANTQGINALKSEIATLRNEMDAMKEKIAEMGTVASETVTQVGNTMSNIISKTSEEIGLTDEWVSALRIADASLSPTIAHLSEASKETIRMANGVQKINVYVDKMTGKMGEVSTFSKDIGNYFMNEDKWLKQNVANLERKENTLRKITAELKRQGSEIKRNLTYEEEMEATNNLIQNSIGKEIANRIKVNAEIEKANELYMQNIEIEKASANLEKEMVTFLTEENGLIQQITGSHEKSMTAIKEELALEERKLGVIEEETAMLNEQGAVRQRNAMKGNDLDKMSYLPRRIGSMALTMWGFNEIMDIYNKSMQNMNALGQQKAYTDLMKTDNRYLEQTDQNVSDVTSGINKMNKAINESYKGGMSLQKMYQKVDMQSVGANAMDSAFKYGVQADKLDELTEVMAIYGSEFVRQGRSQEDSILAVNDALDGEYRRLKEVNIGKEELEAHGYEEGDTLSMIKALREIAEERGYDVVAQKVTNLSDAITVLEIRIAQDLVGAFKVLEPILTEVANDFIYMLDTFEWGFNILRDGWNKFTTELDKTFGVQNVQKFGGGLLKFTGWAITLGITFLAVYKIVKSLKGMLSGLFGIFKKGEDIGGSVAKDTGGIAKTGSDVGFKQGFKNEFSKLGKNLGKMARVFIEFAVALAMAWVLIREAMWIISDIGREYEAVKPQFEQGVTFLKEYGLSMALIGGAFVVLGFIVDKIPKSVITSTAKGMAILMGLIAEAIVLLVAPLGALALVGGLYNWQQGNIQSGLGVIRMVGEAINYIANDGSIALFMVGFVALSLLLGLVQPLTVAMAIGIASALLLVSEAIVMLIPPLGAIALLGASASTLGQDNINQGAEALKIVGQALKTIADAVPSLLIVDVGVFGQELMDWGSQLLTGKDGLTYLSEEIIPNLATFVQSFNNVTIDPIDTSTVANLTQVANQLPSIKTAIDKVRTSIGNGGTGGINILGFQIGGDTSSLKPKLDILYNDIKDVMDFATKLGNLSGDGKGVSAITQTANAIAQLKAKLDLMVSTITTSSAKVKNASNQLGSALTNGFKEGSNGFSASVVQVLAKGISEVQSRYPTWQSGGKASADKLVDGFNTIGGKLKQSISTEMGYALAELDNYEDDFYNKGAMLGDALVRGFKSRDALDQNSPAKITKSIREELGYSMEALNVGRQMMYNGGVALGQALYNGYNSTGNIRTNVDVLTSKGISNEQLQATARNIQANTNKKGQTQQSLTPIINIDMSNSTVIGVQDLDARIRESVEKAIVNINSPNGAIGY